LRTERNHVVHESRIRVKRVALSIDNSRLDALEDRVGDDGIITTWMHHRELSGGETEPRQSFYAFSHGRRDKLHLLSTGEVINVFGGDIAHHPPKGG